MGNTNKNTFSQIMCVPFISESLCALRDWHTTSVHRTSCVCLCVEGVNLRRKKNLANKITPEIEKFNCNLFPQLSCSGCANSIIQSSTVILMKRMTPCRISEDFPINMVLKYSWKPRGNSIISAAKLRPTKIIHCQEATLSTKTGWKLDEGSTRSCA